MNNPSIPLTIPSTTRLSVAPSDTGHRIEIMSDTPDMVNSLTEFAQEGVITIRYSGGALEFSAPTSIALTVGADIDIGIGATKKRASKKDKEENESGKDETNALAAKDQRIIELTNNAETLHNNHQVEKAAQESKIAELETKVAELNSMLEEATAPKQQAPVVLGEDGKPIDPEKATDGDKEGTAPENETGATNKNKNT